MGVIDPEEILSLPLNIEERGLHVTLIAHHMRDGDLPGSIAELAEKVRVAPQRFEVLWERVGIAFELRDGRYVHPQTAERLAKKRAVSESRRGNANARWTNAKASGSMQTHPFAMQKKRLHDGPPAPLSPLSPDPSPPLPPEPPKDKPPVSPSADRAARKREVPADWAPTPGLIAWAETEYPTVDWREQTVRFVRSCRARGAKYVRIEEAWQNWISGKFTDRPPPRAAPAQRSLTEISDDAPTRGRYDDYAPKD